MLAAVACLVPIILYGVIVGRVDRETPWLWLSPAWAIGRAFGGEMRITYSEEIPNTFWPIVIIASGMSLVLIRYACQAAVATRQVFATTSDTNPRD